MGGLACAKQIIDNGNALTMGLRCMDASIQLHAGSRGVYPTYDQRDRLKAAMDAVLKIAAEITVHVEYGLEEWERKNEKKGERGPSGIGGGSNPGEYIQEGSGPGG